ncbi:MAG: hypothetical protein H0U76_11770, partial [Ktedonobacteraceae bacterium]|nr:hypothetical protein [Ktedonobacteraceae bacterium]
MQYVKRVWRFLGTEPALWLFCCFFQPATFRKDIETKSLRERMAMVLRLLALLFLCSYPPVLLVRSILLLAAPGPGGLYPLYTFSGSL